MLEDIMNCKEDYLHIFGKLFLLHVAAYLLMLQYAFTYPSPYVITYYAMSKNKQHNEILH